MKYWNYVHRMPVVHLCMDTHLTGKDTLSFEIWHLSAVQNIIVLDTSSRITYELWNVNFICCSIATDEIKIESNVYPYTSVRQACDGHSSNISCVKYNDVLDSAQMPYLKWQCIFSFSCRNCLPSRAPWFTLGFWWCPCCSLFLVLCVVLFVVLYLSSSYVSCAQFCQCLWIIHCFPSVFSNVYLVYSCHFHLPWLRGKDCFNCQQKSIWNWCVTLVYYFVILTWRPSFAL
jgi:hypothetical protein